MDALTDQMNVVLKKENKQTTNASFSITFIRFFVCILIVFALLFLKKNNADIYSSVKDKYLIGNSVEIIDRDALIDQMISLFSFSSDFLKTCTLNIFRSVTF